MTIHVSYTFDDIGLVPKNKSTIEHRDDVSLETEILGQKLKFPILLAPMKTVLGVDMAVAALKQGLLPILPRGDDAFVDGNLITNVKSLCPYDTFFASVPATDPLRLDKHQDSIQGFCIDVANGFSIVVERAVKELQSKYPNKPILTGNVASLDGFKFLSDLGVAAVRCCIGSGHACETSVRTGLRYGSFSLIRELAAWREATHTSTIIIMDGGMRGPADIVKAIAAGADCVMIGKLFAACKESPGEIIKFKGKLWKHFAGQASHAVKRSDKYIEGDDSLVEYSGSLERTLSEISNGMKSSLSYLNCRTISELKYLPDENFSILTNASQNEGKVQI